VQLRPGLCNPPCPPDNRTLCCTERLPDKLLAKIYPDGLGSNAECDCLMSDQGEPYFDPLIICLEKTDCSDEWQRLSVVGGPPTSGEFVLRFEGDETDPIPYNATASEVQTALENLITLKPGDIECQGGPLPGDHINIFFIGDRTCEDILELVWFMYLDDNPFDVGTPSVTTIENGGFSWKWNAGDAPFDFGDLCCFENLCLELRCNAHGVDGIRGECGDLQLKVACINDAELALSQNCADELSIASWRGPECCSCGSDCNCKAIPRWKYSVVVGDDCRCGSTRGFLVEIVCEGCTIAWDPECSCPLHEAVDEQQKIEITGSPIGGTFTLIFKGEETARIPYNALASQVCVALRALDTIPQDTDIFCTGGRLPNNPVIVNFTCKLGGKNQPLLDADDSDLLGGTNPEVVITTVTEGVEAQCFTCEDESDASNCPDSTEVVTCCCNCVPRTLQAEFDTADCPGFVGPLSCTMTHSSPSPRVDCWECDLDCVDGKLKLCCTAAGWSLSAECGGTVIPFAGCVVHCEPFEYAGENCCITGGAVGCINPDLVCVSITE
jgi:hypothetical protein